jgi:hypothetical protein
MGTNPSAITTFDCIHVNHKYVTSLSAINRDWAAQRVPAPRFGRGKI